MSDRWLQAVSTYMTTEVASQVLVGFASYTSYYAGLGYLGFSGNPSFLTKVGLSMGYKLYSVVTEPALTQIVNAVTEVSINQMNYEDNSTVSGPNPAFPFDAERYQETVVDKLAPLTWNNLFTGGILSAVASEIKNVAYDAIGFTPYSKNTVCQVCVDTFCETSH